MATAGFAGVAGLHLAMHRVFSRWECAQEAGNMTVNSVVETYVRKNGDLNPRSS